MATNVAWFLDRRKKRALRDQLTDQPKYQEIISETLIRGDQENHMEELLEALSSNHGYPKKYILYKPFLDHRGIIGCESRLKDVTRIQEEAATPILLDKKSALAEEIIKTTHWKQLKHQGGERTLTSEIRNRYLIIGASKIARKVCQECNLCIRRKNLKPMEILVAGVHATGFLK